MALEHGMIDPFVENQVREGVISYGVSSYGYDIRVADEYKIFTNVNNAIVDPKHFDESSFVSLKSDICVIPPNSFVLARSLERMRIPRNVLVVCVGKSTYARCFRGDTRVALVDGTTPTLEEMSERAAKGELFWGYSIGEFGRIIVSLLEAPRYIGQDSLLEITLDNGQVIHCTPDHQFIMRDGQSNIADLLRPGDSLMPLYRNLARGYEMLYQPINGHLYPTHRLADEWNLRHGIYEHTSSTHRHYIDHNRQNNNPWNIERMDAAEHIRYHNMETFGEDFDPEEHSLAIRESLQRLMLDEEWAENYSAVQRERAVNFWYDDSYAEKRQKLLEWRKEHLWTESWRQQRREEMIAYFNDTENRERHSQLMRNAWMNDDGSRRQRQQEIARQINIRPEITKERVREALDQAGSIRGAARLLACDRSVFRRFPNTIKAYKNHKIVSIRPLKGDHSVFCLTVPEAGNFALKAGVFVHNCGLILNVTPLEPEWAGYITLEISNTTPLPARIYSNEGIGQLLFFESDQVCETSYADRKGKYQDQTDVTLPRL